ncbi:hypothetical protein Gpo141_00011840 [Globisporangium polare]
MDSAASKRQHLHASNSKNNNSAIQQLKPTSTSAPHNQTICKQRRPQEPQVAAESNQNEARATRRVAVTAEQAQCADESDRTTTARPPMVVVLRRCEDLRIRTSGFQKIEEDSQRRPMDLRRQHKLLEQQQQQQQQQFSC